MSDDTEMQAPEVTFTKTEIVRGGRGRPKLCKHPECHEYAAVIVSRQGEKKPRAMCSAHEDL